MYGKSYIGDRRYSGIDDCTRCQHYFYCWAAGRTFLRAHDSVSKGGTEINDEVFALYSTLYGIAVSRISSEVAATPMSAADEATINVLLRQAWTPEEAAICLLASTQAANTAGGTLGM